MGAVSTSGRDVHVVLVHPEIPWNTGNVGRTCLAAGAQLHLVRPLGFRLDGPEVARAGLDYWPRVAPRVWTEWAELERELPGLGEPYLFTSEAAMDHWDVTYSWPPVLIFGCESVGLPRDLRERFSRQVRIPMWDPEIRSLNLSSCVAVVLYEALRQRRTVS